MVSGRFAIGGTLAWTSQDPQLTTELLQIRRRIALDCARQDFDGAMAAWNKGAEFIERLPNTKIKGLLRESWGDWNEEIRQKQSQMTTT